MPSRRPRNGHDARLARLLYRAVSRAVQDRGWRIQVSARRPHAGGKRILEQCWPQTRLIILYPRNHDAHDSLSRSLWHGALHAAFDLKADRDEERLVTSIEEATWPRFTRRQIARLEWLARRAPFERRPARERKT